MVARRVQRAPEWLVSKVLYMLADASRVVPYPDSSVGAARDQQRLLHAGVEACHRAVMESSAGEQREMALVRPGREDVDVGDREGGQL